jgi:hypothetical protein
MPLLEHLAKLFFVLLVRHYDVDGRRITKLERFGGFLRVFSAVAIPFVLLDVMVYLIRKDVHQFGVEMLHLAAYLLALAFGMYWNRVAVGGDLNAYLVAENHWKDVEREKRAERMRRYAEERRESELRRRHIEMEIA